MFELKDGPVYKVHNKINKDTFTWKEYNQTLEINEHNFIQIKVPLHDVAFLGTSNYIKNL